MNCTDFEKLIALEVEGDLPQPQEGAVREHLRACIRCHEFAEGLKASQAMLKGLAEEALNEATLDEVRTRVRVGLAAQTNRPSFAVWRWALVAGAGAALFLAALILHLLVRKTVPQAIVTKQTTATVAASLVTPALRDSLLPQTGKKTSARNPTPSSSPSLRTSPSGHHPEPLTIKLLTDNPNVVIYWQVE